MDTLIATGIILMVIGALLAAGCVKKIKVEEVPRNFIMVEREVDELRDQWGKTWVVLEKEKMGLEQEHHGSATGRRRGVAWRRQALRHEEVQH